MSDTNHPSIVLLVQKLRDTLLDASDLIDGEEFTADERRRLAEEVSFAAASADAFLNCYYQAIYDQNKTNPATLHSPTDILRIYCSLMEEDLPDTKIS